jgi:hypothetical protein
MSTVILEKLILQSLFYIYLISSLQTNKLNNDTLKNCITQIVNENFHFSRTIILTAKHLDLNNVNDFSSVIRLDFAEMHVLQSIKEKVNHVIVVYNDVNELNETVSLLKNSYCFNSRAKYLVIATTFEDIILISNILWNYRLYKSVILWEDNEKINIFEVDLKKSNCGKNINFLRVGYFYNNELKVIHKLFDPDMKNQFYDCTLKVIYSHIYPWINNNSSGVFVEVLNTFAEINGFNLVYMPENPIYGEELQNSYSFESVRNDLESGYADIYLGLGNNLQNVIMETTTTVYDDNLYWVVPKASRMAYWKAMIKYFPIHFWASILVFFVIICTIFCFIAYKIHDENKFKDIIGNVLYMFSIAINFPISKMPVNKTLRILVTIYCWISLLTCVVLQARLYDIFSNPVYENDITDLDKLLDSRLPLKFSDGLAILFLFTGPQNQRVFDTYIGTNLTLMESLDQLINSKDFATIIDTGVLVMRPNIRNVVNIFDIAYFQTCIYMKKNHELFEILNEAVKKIVETGFVNKFVSDVRWQCFLRDRSNNEDNGFFELSLSHIQGAFMVLLYGQISASVICIFELIYASLKTKFTKCLLC